MNKIFFPLVTASLMISGLMPDNAIAGLSVGTPETSELKENLATSLSGAWQDTNGEYMLIREKDSFLDVLGRDAISTYKMVCLIDSPESSKYNCVGEGDNHQKNSRFIYRSTLEITQEGTIKESWEALTVDEEIQGTAVFEKLTSNEQTQEER